MRGYQTKQIVDNNQAPLGLVISTVATGTVSDPVQYRTSPGITDPHPRGVFFSALELKELNPLYNFFGLKMMFY